MANTVTMFATSSSPRGQIQTQNSGNVFVASNGTVLINPLDVAAFLNLGFIIGSTQHVNYQTPGAPGVASAVVTVASVSISAGSTTLTIAAQPIVPRQLQAVIDPGTLAISAGTLTLTYVGNDGAVHADALSLVTAVSTLLTVATSFGVEHLTSAIITGLAGGVGWLRGIGTNGVLALPVPAGAASIVGTRESIISTSTLGISTGVDEAVGSVVPSSGLWTPTTAPNATQMLSIGYNYVAAG